MNVAPRMHLGKVLTQGERKLASHKVTRDANCVSHPPGEGYEMARGLNLRFKPPTTQALRDSILPSLDVF